MTTPADASSIALSSPKAMSVRLPAARPAPSATTPSTTIHATVIHSRRNACRISAARSDVSDNAEGVERQQGSAQLSAGPRLTIVPSTMLMVPLGWPEALLEQNHG